MPVIGPPPVPHKRRRDPRERLRRWISETHGGNQVRAAAQIGCHQTCLVHLLNKPKRCPSLGVAVAIEDATREWEEGPILVRDWRVAS